MFLGFEISPDFVFKYLINLIHKVYF